VDDPPVLRRRRDRIRCPGEDDHRENGQDRHNRQGGLWRELGAHVEALGPSARILALTALLDKLGER